MLYKHFAFFICNKRSSISFMRSKVITPPSCYIWQKWLQIEPKTPPDFLWPWYKVCNILINTRIKSLKHVGTKHHAFIYKDFFIFFNNRIRCVLNKRGQYVVCNDIVRDLYHYFNHF